MKRRTFLASAAAAALSPVPGLADPPTLILFDAAVYLSSPNTKRYPTGGPGSREQGGPRGPIQNGVEQSYNPLIVTAEDLLRWKQQLGVGSVAAIQNQPLYGYDNTYLLDSSKNFPAQISPVIILQAQLPRAADFFRKMVSQNGVAAIRMEGVAGGGSMPWIESKEALEIWNIASQAGIVIDILYLPDHLSPRAMETFSRLAGRFPNVRICISHLGWPAAAGAPDFGITPAVFRPLLQHSNIMFKYTVVNLRRVQSANIPPAQFIAHVVDVLGADRVMWGSDLGADQTPYAYLVKAGRDSASMLSPEAQQKVMHDNGHGFYIRGGLPTAP